MIDYIDNLYKHKTKYDEIYCDENALNNYNEIVFITSFDDMKKNIFNQSKKIRYNQDTDNDVNEKNFFLRFKKKKKTRLNDYTIVAFL